VFEQQKLPNGNWLKNILRKSNFRRSKMKSQKLVLMKPFFDNKFTQMLTLIMLKKDPRLIHLIIVTSRPIQRLGLRLGLGLKKPLLAHRGLKLTVILESYKHDLEA